MTGRSALTNGGETFAVRLTLGSGNGFRVDFDDGHLEPLVVEERQPRGTERGPSPMRLLAAAVASSLAASLLDCLRKVRVPIDGFGANAVTTVSRDKSGHLCVDRIRVILDPRVPPSARDQLSKCAEQFERNCTLAMSVRQGIDIRVSMATT